jgi:5-methyltetrahydrofolate--homocysteine methyltransferase
MRIKEAIYRLRKLRLKQKLRREMTPAEKILWQALRNRKLYGTKWRRQSNIDIFIADFRCPEHRLIVEVDGPIHQYKIQQDQCRTDVINQYDYRVLRFTNEEVLSALPVVLQKITAVIEKSL